MEENKAGMSDAEIAALVEKITGELCEMALLLASMLGDFER